NLTMIGERATPQSVPSSGPVVARPPKAVTISMGWRGFRLALDGAGLRKACMGDGLVSGVAGATPPRKSDGQDSALPSAKPAPRHYYAALDLGTNNCRLLIAHAEADGFRVIDSFSRIIRLGEGVSQSGQISEGAIRRAVGALKICRDKMRARDVMRSRL